MTSPEREPFGLKLQTLPLTGDRILVVSQLAGLVNGTQRFTAANVDSLFDAFRVPRPSKTSTILGQLQQKGHAVRLGKEWALSPIAEKRVREVVGHIDDAVVRHELSRGSGADFAHARHTVLPPALAPSRWSRGIGQLLNQSPFESNVFCMLRFPEEGAADDPLRSAISAARSALADHDLRLYLANDATVEDDLLGNVAAYMWGCKYGLAIFEDRVARGLNYNLVIEVGAMLMAGRRCVLLRDRTAPKMPTDLVGQIYRGVDLDDVLATAAAVHEWAAGDLGLGRCGSCPRER